MQYGNSFISVKNIVQALEAMATGSGSPPVALTALTLVDEFLSNPSLPPSEQLRDFAVFQILSKLITEEYSRYAVFDENTLLETHLRAVKQNASPRLMTWSFLYCHYVQMTVSLEEFARQVGITDRTLRRYRSVAIRRLKEKLLKAEWQTRDRLIKRRLYAALPSIPVMKLIGKDEVMEEAWSVLQRKDEQRHFIVTGPAGCGKTTFVQELIRKQIDGGQLQQLIWFDSPQSLEEIHQIIETQLYQSEQHHIGLREYSVIYPIAIVLDDISQLMRENLDEFLQYFSAAFVYLINITFVSLRSTTTHLTMRYLDRHEIEVFLRLSGAVNNEHTHEMAAMFEEITGGNPLAIRLLLHTINSEKAILTNVDHLQYLFDKFYQQLPAHIKKAWFLLVLLPSHSVSVDYLLELGVTKHDIEVLRSNHIAEIQDNGRVTLFPTALRYLHKRRDENLFDETLQQLVRHLDEHPDDELIEHLLFTVNLPTILKNKWLRLLLNRKIVTRQRWHVILEKCYLSDEVLEFDLLIEYGRSLRRFAKWEMAQKVLRQIIQQAGSKGHFLSQMWAFIELGVVYRATGHYQAAFDVFEEVIKTSQRYHNLELFHAAKIEQIQILVDTKDGERAIALLNNLPETGRVLSLQAESYLLLQQHNEGLNAALQALKYYQQDRLHLGKVYILLGRLFLADNKFQQASQYFSAAILIFEIEAAVFTLARARMNYGITFMHLNMKTMAREWLERAYKIQAQIGDVMGLAITQHNLDWCIDKN